MYGIVFFGMAVIYLTISIIVSSNEEKRKFWLGLGLAQIAIGLFALALGLLKGI